MGTSLLAVRLCFLCFYVKKREQGVGVQKVMSFDRWLVLGGLAGLGDNIFISHLLFASC